ncbi:metal-binding protein [Leptolyngbya sp. Heron Island J]|uniref:CHAD domain-containing protein n=1 Tax=Leptolyngbya sp. Heron Island J TaxID=1385935 RepID=UPI0003B94A7F|nr:CHAD domain-containing protein [Leptolyngbya sp. Heron Island J]ESA36469.1 metal-binding protein [Leptolyngbya sp. Heron Island J]
MKPQATLAVAYVSQRPAQEQSQHVGNYAHQAIKKYVNHIRQQEKGVLAHRDPEFLHQMRVGLRRLRTVCAAFDFAIDLPKAVSDRALKRLGKTLGNVRDLDVLQYWLKQYSRQAKPKKSEAKVLRRLNRQLEKQRQKYVVQTDKLLRSNAYKRIFKAIKHWLKHPQYQPVSSLPLAVALPDLQLPMVAQLLLHPGWLVTNDTNHKELEQVHALRKQVKGVRYQMALFREFYGEDYRAQVNTFKQMQDVLGELQDEVVLQSYLKKTLGAKWTKKLPSLNRYFRQQHRQLWQQWLELRQPYLSLAGRNALHRLFLAA